MVLSVRLENIFYYSYLVVDIVIHQHGQPFCVEGQVQFLDVV